MTWVGLGLAVVAVAAAVVEHRLRLLMLPPVNHGQTSERLAQIRRDASYARLVYLVGFVLASTLMLWGHCG